MCELQLVRTEKHVSRNLWRYLLETDSGIPIEHSLKSNIKCIQKNTDTLHTSLKTTQ